MHDSSGAWAAEPRGSREEGSSSRGSSKRGLDDGDGDGSAVVGGTSPGHVMEEGGIDGFRASKRRKLDPPGGGAAAGPGGREARGERRGRGRAGEGNNTSNRGEREKQGKAHGGKTAVVSGLCNNCCVVL